jgi:hypothetical protein
MTKSEEEFVDQMTRKLMVEACDRYTRTGNLQTFDDPYFFHALEKGWVNDTGKPLSAGFATAARFLKR